MDINELFLLGMKRRIEPLIAPDSKQINLGCGNSQLKDCINLDYPEWDATCMTIPHTDAYADTIWAFHFFEHLSGSDVLKCLRECERVLKVGGTLNVVVPYFNSALAAQDLDHKSFWCEESWRTLFDNPYYNKGREQRWRFRIGTNIIIGIVERNMCLMTQLIRIN